MRRPTRSTPFFAGLFAVGTVAALSLTDRAGAQEVTVRSSDGRATLSVPSNAVPAGVVVTVERVVPETDPSVVNATRYRIDPAAVRFAQPGVLTVAYESADVPAGAAESSLRTARLDGDAWTLLAAARGALHAKTVAASVDRGGVVAVRWHAGGVHCGGPESHLFDFRLGVWNYRAVGYDPGRAVIVADPSGCALYEHYADVTGGRAERFYLFDSATRAWAVTTIDPGGRSVSTTAADSRGIAIVTGNDREVFSRQTDGRIFLAGEHSADGGRSWTAAYNAIYTPVADSARPARGMP